MIFHENPLPADDSHELLFLKKGKITNCRLLQIIGGTLRNKIILDISCESSAGAHCR